jgi:hypothetical protein
MSKALRGFESEAKFRITKCKNVKHENLNSLQTRKDKESEVLKLIDEVGFQLTLELAKGKKSREETEDRCAEELSLMVERIESEVDMEKRAREESNQRLFEDLNRQVERCAEMMQAERAAREETETSLIQMIQDMEGTLMQEI